VANRRKFMNGAGIYECPAWCLGEAMEPDGAELGARRHVGDWVQILQQGGPDGLTEAWARPIRDWLNWELEQHLGEEYIGVEYYLTPVTDYAALSVADVSVLRVGLQYVQDLAESPPHWVWAYRGADRDLAEDQLDAMDALRKAG